MSPDEAQRVVRILNGAWGYFAGPDNADRVSLWTEKLLRLGFEPTRAAAKRAAETCERLPSLAEFLRFAREEARLARLAAAAPVLAPGESTHACRCGDLRGWVVVDHGNPPTLRPCPTCRPEATEHWSGGHWMPDHTCPECERRKKAA